MDQIPFTKVSIEEAKAALHADSAQARIAPRKTGQWESRRSPQNTIAQDLTPNTFKWLASFPKEKRPSALALQFPRIANRLAEIWKRPLQCERYLDDLMLDRRGGRQGFPNDVAADIAKLKLHFLATCSAVHFGVWGDRIGVD